MERPPEWRVETTADFDQEFEALSLVAERLEDHLRSWRFFLARDPYRYSTGLTSVADDERYLAKKERLDEVEYVVGITMQPKHVVLLTWIESRPLLPGE